MTEQTGAAKAAAGAFARWGTVQINVTENVKLETLHAVIDHIASLSGCRTCGLVGVDLVLRGDPELGNIRTLPGVTGASFVR